MITEEMRIGEFSEALASSSPAPGGGGASSLAGSLGAALGLMVARLTTGKKKYADFEERLSEIIPELSLARAEFLRLADEDEENFLPLSAAYKLPRDTEEERRLRDEVMEKSLRLACDAPYKTLRLAHKTALLVEELQKNGSRLAVSDTGVGAKLLETALSASILNIFINTKMMKDRSYAESLNKKASELFDTGSEVCARIYDNVYKELGSEGV